MTAKPIIAKANRARISNLDPMHGIKRIDRGAKNGWMVAVYHLVDVDGEKKQKPAFTRKFFPDPVLDDLSEAQKRSFASAKRYRDKGLASANIPKASRKPVVLRSINTELKGSEGKNSTRTTADLYGITRDDRPAAPRLAGWRVRIAGQKQKYFGDQKFGGKRASLKEAKIYRDKIIGDKPIVERALTPLRKARIAAGISQETAAAWMGIQTLAFGKMERSKTGVNKKYEELFIKYCKKELDPYEDIPKIDLFEFRRSLGYSQTQMSTLITGANSQSPWASWETGKISVPYWVARYIAQILVNTPTTKRQMAF